MEAQVRLCLTILLAFLLTSFGPLAFGQSDASPGTVRGTAVDAAAGRPLPGANVAVRRAADSTLIGGAVADSTGQFVVRGIPLGQYAVTVSFSGYQSVARTIELSERSPTYVMGTVRLRRSRQQMQEATVTAQQPAVTIQGSERVYNVGQREVALAGKSSIDVLEGLSSVRVSEGARGASIQLRGSGSVSVRINGNPVPMRGRALVQRLRSISASRIERVEVNTNPSARQEAEGTAGIINIVLSEPKRTGWNGGTTLSAGSVPTEILPRLRSSGHVGYEKEAWSVYGSYGYTRFENDVAARMRRRGRGDATRSLLQQSTGIGFEMGGHNVTTEAEYTPDSSTTLTFESTASWQDQLHQRRVVGTTRSAPDTSRSYRRATEVLTSQRDLTGNFSAKRKLGSDHTLSADIQYTHARSGTDARETEARGEGPRERRAKQDEDQEGSLSLDYKRPAGPLTLEIGYKGTFRRLNQKLRSFQVGSATGEFNDNPFQAERLDYDEHVQAGYVVLQGGIGPVDAEAGLRVERTDVSVRQGSGPGIENRYVNLFPSASLTYDGGAGRKLSLSYSNRLDRPSISQISAFGRSFSLNDPRFRYVGNPDLRPEQTHSLELTALQRVGMATITATPFARLRTDAIRSVRVARSDSVTVQTYDNYDVSSAYGTELRVSLSAGDVEANIGGTLFHRTVRGGAFPGASGKRRTTAASGRASVTWEALSGLQIQASQYYRSARESTRGRIDPFYRTSLSAEKTIWSERGTLGLEINDPFRTSEFGYRTRTQRYAERVTRNWTGRSVSLSFSYQFGSASREGRPSASGGGGGPMGGG